MAQKPLINPWLTITFKKDREGECQFEAVEGYIGYRIETWEGRERLEFLWEGNDEMDVVSGRGWAEIKGDDLHGRLYFHLGDDSWFIARRAK